MLELDLILENAFSMESPDLGGRNQMGMTSILRYHIVTLLTYLLC